MLDESGKIQVTYINFDITCLATCVFSTRPKILVAMLAIELAGRKCL
jgi:hypothetical protein